jgi:hypothetical protein
VIPKRTFKYVVYSPGRKDEEYQLKEYVDGRGFGSAVPEDIDTDFDTQHPRAFRIKWGNPREILERWVLRNKEFLGDWYLARYPGQQISEHRGRKSPVEQFVPLPDDDYGGNGADFVIEPRPADEAGPVDPLPEDDDKEPGSSEINGFRRSYNSSSSESEGGAANNFGNDADNSNSDDSDAELLALLSQGAAEQFKAAEAAEEFALGRPAKRRRDDDGAGPAYPDGTSANSKSIDFTRLGWNRFRIF